MRLFINKDEIVCVYIHKILNVYKMKKKHFEINRKITIYTRGFLRTLKRRLSNFVDLLLIIEYDIIRYIHKIYLNLYNQL